MNLIQSGSDKQDEPNEGDSSSQLFKLVFVTPLSPSPTLLGCYVIANAR